mmetsp:Transcript_11702/g.17372  ORF Transcript_11702/g.17372 Transcript_11702/m.17372 type:complete len:101 (-) Transcript_11702:1113-1415(-)
MIGAMFFLFIFGMPILIIASKPLFEILEHKYKTIHMIASFFHKIRRTVRPIVPKYDFEGLIAFVDDLHSMTPFELDAYHEEQIQALKTYEILQQSSLGYI